jgi:two-component system, OmpR family, KDP operon response regulator KdpE
MTQQETRDLMRTVLLVDDEPQIRRLLRVILETAGYRVIESATGQEGLSQAAQRRPDVVLLDLGLPDVEGTEVLRRIREWSRVPIIILSVRDREPDKVTALDSGADDYVTKPFNSAELLARLRAALRHMQPGGPDAVFRSGALEVDLSKRTVFKQGCEVRLTPIEYSLLRLLVTHAGKVLTHRQLLTEVWGEKAANQSHYLRVHIAHLRNKIESNPSAPELIITEPSIGYRLIAIESELPTR